MNQLNRTKTARGFDLVTFSDSKGVECSLQESSAACERAIWLGCNDAEPRHLVPSLGWQPVPMPESYIANTRMHLTQEHVAALLPFLQRFALTGEL